MVARAALLTLLLTRTAFAQFYVESVTPGAYVPLANIPGIQNVTPFTFSGSDDGSATVPIPFTYMYLGQPYAEARVATNGYVVFGAATDFGGYTNVAIGSPNGADNVIAVWWDDLILPAASGYSSHGTIGTAPSRIFVIEIRSFEHYSLAGINDGNWQVWLYEGPSGRFDVKVDGVLEASEAYSATAGWEGPNGAPFGAFVPCSLASPYCNETHYATMVGNVYSVEQAQGPELTGSVGVFPRGALPGGIAAGPITVRNIGTEDVSNVQSSLYLSLDAQVGAGDFLVGGVSVPLLAAGNFPVTLTATITVPPGAPPGDYFLLLEVDSARAVTEVSETNNVAAAAARFATAHDLAPIGAVVPVGGNPGQNVVVDVDVASFGVPYLGTATVRVFASTNATYDATDTVIGTTTIDLTGALQEAFSLPFVLPSLSPGSYYPIVSIDAGNTVVEYNETNNVLVGPTRFPVGPDFLITGFFSPGGADPGQPITFDVTVRNDGVPYAGPVSIRIVASPDPIFDVNDPVLGTDTIILTGVTSETVPATITMPPLPPDVYYPIAILDPNDVIDEVNDFNNTFTGLDTFTSGSDFQITDIDGPAAAVPGVPMFVMVTIASPGAPFTGTFTYRLYLSSDETFDAADVAIGEYGVVFAGETSLVDPVSPVFPVALPPTGHYLIGVADPDDDVTEADEGNNVTADDQEIGSGTDFRPYDVNLDRYEAAAGEDIAVSATIRADGNPYFGGVEYRIYLSDDFYLDPADYRVFDGIVFFNGEPELSFTSSVTIPVIVPEDYEVFVEVDPNNTIPEPSETNNDYSDFFDLDVVGPNLTVDSITAAPQAFVGIPYPIQLTVRNPDVADAVAFRYAYYVTTTGLLTPPSGTQIYVSPTRSLLAGAAETYVDLVDVPGQMAPSAFVQIGVILDFAGVVLESDESDNQAFIPGSVQVLTPVADLVPAINETSNAAGAGEDLAVTRTLVNSGVADSPSFAYRYYLSSNAAISPDDDILIGSYTAQLDLDAFDRAIDVVNIPATVTPGVYFLGLVTDPDDLVLETNEGNNVALGPEVRVYEPALMVHTDELPSAVLGVEYAAKLFAIGPTGGRTWSITSGTLPDGIALDALEGDLTGTPTRDDLFSFIVRVTAGNAYAERALTIRVRGATVPIEVVSRVLPYAIVGRTYDTELVAVGGAPPYQWGLRSTLPEGLIATSTGTIRGAPSSAGRYDLDVVVTDQEGSAGAAIVRLEVISPDQVVTLTQSPLPEATVGLEYCQAEPIRFFASGGYPPYTYAAVSGLAPGMTLSEAGELCGVPELAGEYHLVARVEDGAGVFDTSLFLLRVRSTNELAITVTTLVDGYRGVPYEAALSARRGMEPYAWSLFGDGVLPPGLELGADGVIRGTPSEVGSWTFVAQVTDAFAQTRLQPLSIRIADALPEDGGGCGCSAHGAGGAPALWLLVALVMRRRRGAASSGPTSRP